MAREDKMKNENKVKIVVIDKMRNNRLRWLGRVLRLEEIDAVRLVKRIYVDRMRGKGWPKINKEYNRELICGRRV